jgi:hypothetical protein
MKKLLLIIIISFSGICANAQTDLDYLYSMWQDEAQTDSIRIIAYNHYIWNGFLFSNPDSAFKLAKVLADFAQEKQYPRGKAIAYNLQGISFDVRGNYPKALDYYTRSL